MAPPAVDMQEHSGDSVTEKRKDSVELKHHEGLPSADALAEAMAKEKLSPWSRPLLKLYGYCAVAFLCSTMNGMSP